MGAEALARVRRAQQPWRNTCCDSRGRGALPWVRRSHTEHLPQRTVPRPSAPPPSASPWAGPGASTPLPVGHRAQARPPGEPSEPLLQPTPDTRLRRLRRGARVSRATPAWKRRPWTPFPHRTAGWTQEIPQLSGCLCHFLPGQPLHLTPGPTCWDPTLPAAGGGGTKVGQDEHPLQRPPAPRISSQPLRQAGAPGPQRPPRPGLTREATCVQTTGSQQDPARAFG